MARFMMLTFTVLGWTFFELSGGTDFRPPEAVPTPRIAQAEPASPAGGLRAGGAEGEAVIVPALLTASDEGALVVTGTSEFAAPTLVPAGLGAPAPVPGTDPGADSGADLGPGIEAALVAAQEPAIERRTVAGERVNLRAGPGTSHGVLGVLSRGEAAEVLAVEGGWARIRIEGESGRSEGWMALSLLSEAG